MTGKVVKGKFSDERIKVLYDKISDVIAETAGELQLPYATVIGVIENIKHDLQHEITAISADMIDYGP